MFDFNSMSTHLELFYFKRLKNCIHCTFISTFFCVVVLEFFFLAHDLIEYKSCLNSSIWQSNETNRNYDNGLEWSWE